MDEPPVPGWTPQTGVNEVLRLTTTLADRVLAQLVAGQPVPEDQCRALSAAVNLLRGLPDPLPPDLNDTIEEIADRAAQAIAAGRPQTSRDISWTFARMRGAQPLTLAARKPPPGA